MCKNKGGRPKKTAGFVRKTIRIPYSLDREITRTAKSATDQLNHGVKYDYLKRTISKNDVIIDALRNGLRNF